SDRSAACGRSVWRRRRNAVRYAGFQVERGPFPHAAAKVVAIPGGRLLRTGNSCHFGDLRTSLPEVGVPWAISCGHDGPPPELAARLQADTEDNWYPLIGCFCVAYH